MMIAANRMKTFGVSFAKTACRFLTTAVLDRCTLAVASLALLQWRWRRPRRHRLAALKASRYWLFTVTNTGPSL